MVAHRLRVVVADDSAPVLEMVSGLLSKHYDLVGEFLDGATVLAKCSELNPDLVILDISMPQMNGLEVAQQLIRLDHPPLIIFLTCYDSREFVNAAFNAGASAYVLKSHMDNDLREAITVVTGGGSFVSQQSA